MSFRKNYTLTGHQEIKYITELTGNSLPLALCLSLLEVVARFYSTKRNIVKPIINSINELIEQSIAQYPQGREYLENLKIVLDRISNLPSPFKSLEYIDSLAINGEEPEENAPIFVIDIASRCLMATLLSHKLTESGRHSELESFFGNNNMKSIDSMILEKFTNHFNIDIQLYEVSTKESICGKKNGCFPLIHLFKQDYRYSLAYPSEFAEIRSNPEFDTRALENLPFYISRKQNGPIRDPNQPKEPEAFFDFTNDIDMMTTLIEVFSKELTVNSVFSPEVTRVATLILEKNERAKKIPGLVNFCNSASMSLRSNAIRTCFVCHKLIDESIRTSHFDCEVCLNCTVDQRYNIRCPKCKGPYTSEDKRMLRLP